MILRDFLGQPHVFTQPQSLVYGVCGILDMVECRHRQPWAANYRGHMTSALVVFKPIVRDMANKKLSLLKTTNHLGMSLRYPLPHSFASAF